MLSYDRGSLLMMFDESMQKIIKHLEDGSPDRALSLAKKVHRALQKIMGNCVGDIHSAIEGKL